MVFAFSPTDFCSSLPHLQKDIDTSMAKSITDSALHLRIILSEKATMPFMVDPLSECNLLEISLHSTCRLSHFHYTSILIHTRPFSLTAILTLAKPPFLFLCTIAQTFVGEVARFDINHRAIKYRFLINIPGNISTTLKNIIPLGRLMYNENLHLLGMPSWYVEAPRKTQGNPKEITRNLPGKFDIKIWVHIPPVLS